MKEVAFRDWYRNFDGKRWFWVSWNYYDFLPWWNPRRHRTGGKLTDIWYYIECRFWRQYNVFRVKTLPPTWQDADEQILHVNFHILGTVINKEGILEVSMWGMWREAMHWCPQETMLVMMLLTLLREVWRQLR